MSLKAATKGMNRNWDDELSDSEDGDQNTFALNITSDSEDSIADSPVGEKKTSV
jgi:hypothetical protein